MQCDNQDRLLLVLSLLGVDKTWLKNDAGVHCCQECTDGDMLLAATVLPGVHQQRGGVQAAAEQQAAGLRPPAGALQPLAHAAYS